MGALTVLYDACVLYPAALRDFSMHLAVLGLFQTRWTEAIHDEWIRNVLDNRPDLKPELLYRTRDLMNAHVPGCLIIGYESLIESLSLPDPDDRHVLAAAIHGGTDVILTFNLKDFPDHVLKPFGIKAQHPDAFLSDQLDVVPHVVCLAAKRHRASLKDPPKQVAEFLDALEQQGLAVTVARLRQFPELI